MCGPFSGPDTQDVGALLQVAHGALQERSSTTLSLPHRGRDVPALNARTAPQTARPEGGLRLPGAVVVRVLVDEVRVPLELEGLGPSHFEGPLLKRR